MSKIHEEKYKIKLRKQIKMSKFINCKIAFPDRRQSHQKSEFNDQLINQHHSADLGLLTTFMQQSKTPTTKKNQHSEYFHNYSSLIKDIDKLKSGNASYIFHNNNNSINQFHSKDEELRSMKNSHHFLMSSLNLNKSPKNNNHKKVLTQGNTILRVSQKNQSKHDEFDNLNVKKPLNKVTKTKKHRFLTQLIPKKLLQSSESYLFKSKIPSSKIMIKDGVRELSSMLNRQSLQMSHETQSQRQLSKIRKKVDKQLMSRFKKVEY